MTVFYLHNGMVKVIGKFIGLIKFIETIWGARKKLPTK